jgi:hypothetical protein
MKVSYFLVIYEIGLNVRFLLNEGAEFLNMKF